MRLPVCMHRGGMVDHRLLDGSSPSAQHATSPVYCGGPADVCVGGGQVDACFSPVASPLHHHHDGNGKQRRPKKQQQPEHDGSIVHVAPYSSQAAAV